MEKKMKMCFNEFIKMKIRESKNAPFLTSPFGLETSGTYINTWQMNYQKLAFFSRYGALAEFSNSVPVEVYVPEAVNSSGPFQRDGQPYGWNGKINEHIAELAVWWAFEILTQDEAAAFMKKSRPVVIFKYLESGTFRCLTVQFNSDRWIVVAEE
jgi:hypothetical protein